MSFLKKTRKLTPNSTEKPTRKKKIKRIVSLVLGVFLICLISFIAYIYANGSRVFDDLRSGSSLVRAVTGDKLDGEDEGRVNILLLGRGGENHPGGLLTDSLQVVSINTKDKKMAMISVPRDLYAPIKDHGHDKINASFAAGYNDYMAKSCKKKKESDCRDGAMEAGSLTTKETVSNVLGIPIQYYVMIDFEGFRQLVDKIGGIDIYVDKALYDPLYPDKKMKGYEPFSIKAGQQHLNGEVALKYSRSRETTSDFDRSRRQQIVLRAVKDKTLSLGILANPKKILDLVNIVGNHVRTNFTPSQIKVAAELMKDINQDATITKVLSSAPDGYLVDDSSSGTYYLKPKGGDFDKIQDMTKNIFNQQGSDREPANVEVYNATKTPGTATKAASGIKSSTLTVVSIKNASERFQKTLIYDYSSGKKKAAVDYLKNKFGAEVVQKTGPGSDVDIAVFIGDDFNATAKTDSEVSKN